jgi:hypothetical protein
MLRAIRRSRFINCNVANGNTRINSRVYDMSRGINLVDSDMLAQIMSSLVALCFFYGEMASIIVYMRGRGGKVGGWVGVGRHNTQARAGTAMRHTYAAV